MDGVVEMYKLAEFRKKLEQRKNIITIPRSDIGRTFDLIRLEYKSRHLDGLASSIVNIGPLRNYIAIRKSVSCAGDAVLLNAKIKNIRNGREREIKPIRDMMKRVNEMYNKPR